MFGNEVFISYARRELYLVLSLTRQLQVQGVDVWLDAARLAPGVDWVSKILEAVHGGTLPPGLCAPPES
jgi:hypothetical protein